MPCRPVLGPVSRTPADSLLNSRMAALAIALAIALAMPAGLGGVRAAPGAVSAVPDPIAFAPVVGDAVDVVVLPAARRPAPRPSVTVATRVHGSPAAVGAVLLDPARYRAALPSLVRAEVVATRPAVGTGATHGPDRLLAWELEIPLFNLKGRLWLSRQADTVELTLVDGSFAPGSVRFRVAALPGGQETVLASDVQVDVRSASWIIRRIARHDPWAETAMTAAAAWALTRAVAMQAEAGGGGRNTASRPTSPISPPPATALDGSALVSAPFDRLRGAGVIAMVRRAATGRLGWISVAVPTPGAPSAVAARLGAPETWAAFPGWKSVRRALPDRGDDLHIEVEDNVAFVDLDSAWRVTYGAAVRATAVAGATRGAVFAWQAYPAAPDGSLAVLSMHPRIDASGYVARKMIAVEPLLEHGLALGLAYASAAAVAAAVADRPLSP